MATAFFAAHLRYIGLRFTNVVNFHGQKICVPDRDIGMISRFCRGAIWAYVDIQIPQAVDQKEVI